MKNNQLYPFLIMAAILVGCHSENKKQQIDENKLGLIDASVKSEDTNLKTMAKFENVQPGSSVKIERAFENAPPMIPHTTVGFFPIKKESNICLTCHMPDKAVTSGAVPLPATHFASMRPKMVEVNGVMTFKEEAGVHVNDLGKLNNAYFNCSQCHVPQASVTVNIENLFTPEFREKFGLQKSSLKEKLNEGIK